MKWDLKNGRNHGAALGDIQWLMVQPEKSASMVYTKEYGSACMLHFNNWLRVQCLVARFFDVVQIKIIVSMIRWLRPSGAGYSKITYTYKRAVKST